jgi:hypothetical protein
MAPPNQVIPLSLEPCHDAHFGGAMRSAHTAWAQCGRLYAGGNGIIPGLVARMSGGTILGILRADDVMNARCVVMTILLGVGALTLHRYDVQCVLISIAIGWFLLGAILLGYRGDHLWGSIVARSGCSLHISAVQTTTRRFDIGFAGAVTSCPRLSGCFRVLGDIETNDGARDMTKQQYARCGRLAKRNQRREG